MNQPLGASLAEQLQVEEDVAARSDVARDKIERSLILELALQIKETPVFFINGRRVIGSHSQGEIDSLIRAELARIEGQDEPYQQTLDTGSEPDLAKAAEMLKFSRMTNRHDRKPIVVAPKRIFPHRDLAVAVPHGLSRPQHPARRVGQVDID